MEVLFSFVVTYILSKYVVFKFIDGYYEEGGKKVFLIKFLISFIIFLILYIYILMNFNFENKKTDISQKPVINVQEEINKQLSKLELLKENDYSKKSYIYSELVKLEPKNNEYIEKDKFYKSLKNLEFECGMIAFNYSKNSTNFPDTFDQIGAKEHFLIEGKIRTRINFLAKNAFGVPMRHTAVYECWEENNTIKYKLLDMHRM